MEATYIGFKMWAQAVAQAGTTQVDAVRQAMYGQKVKAPSGFTAVMNTNHHLSKPVYIGEIRPDGQFNIVWKTKGPIKADAWSKYIPESAKLTADWTLDRKSVVEGKSVSVRVDHGGRGNIKK